MIRQAGKDDLSLVTELAAKLWPGHGEQELEAELREIMEGDSALFLAFSGERAVGFAQCQLRHDYVEGTRHSPVGYLEGIYVEPDSRRQGVAGMLLAACEEWAGRQGCREFASDCELTNSESLRFHLGLGFTEANRIICFTKKL